MKIAVTGSSGFTGKRLVRHLSSLDHEMISIDLDAGIDVTNFETLKEIPKFDILYHLAAKSYVPDSYLTPQDFYRVNINSTLNTLELCRQYNARYIFVSSYVYGNPQYLPIDENHPISPFNPYADTKIMGENLCHAYNKFFDVNVCVVRPFNIYGPRQSHNFLVPFIFNQAVKGKVELGDPNPKRDLIYIDDLIELYASLVQYQNSTFEIFNAGFGKSYSVREIVDLILKLFPSSIEVIWLNKIRPNEVADTISDNKKAKTLLNWTPKIDLAEGLSKIYSALQ